MNLTHPLRWKFVAATVSLALTVPLFAAKRRAVRHPSPGNAIIVKVKGTVLDQISNQPVAYAEITVGDSSTFADRLGRFTVASATIFGVGNVTASRSGYQSESQQVSSAGEHNLTFHLQPKPTVRLRLTNGTTHDVDFETAEFGYVPPFGSYNKAPYEEFCSTGGTTTSVDRSQMRKITGPAVKENAPACCSSGLVTKITVELKNGTNGPMYFADSCGTEYSMDFIGRDHITGDFVYAKMTDVAEILFP